MNDQLLFKFYEAFQKRDANVMSSCYHPRVEFHDPAFGHLKGKEVSAMWEMLCARGKDLSITFSDIQTDEKKGAAHWEATYTFSQTGRKIHNIIDATFEFQDGLIIKHRDHFNLHRWAAQALGWKGQLLGGTSFFRQKLQAQTRRALDKWMTNDGK